MFFVATILVMRGRPKKPEGEAKTYMLRVRMTQEERDLLEGAAKSKSLQLSSWVRSEMLALARRVLTKGQK
jgi:uncharacterized protein (DUF1778 family)